MLDFMWVAWSFFAGLSIVSVGFLGIIYLLVWWAVNIGKGFAWSLLRFIALLTWASVWLALLSTLIKDFS